MSDFLTKGYGRCEIRSRMCVTPAAYGSAVVAFKRAHRRIPSGVKNFVAGCLIGVAGAAWLIVELSK